MHDPFVRPRPLRSAAKAQDPKNTIIIDTNDGDPITQLNKDFGVKFFSIKGLSYVDHSRRENVLGELKEVYQEVGREKTTPQMLAAYRPFLAWDAYVTLYGCNLGGYEDYIQTLKSELMFNPIFCSN